MTRTVTLTDHSDIFMLYMSCLRMAVRKDGTFVEMQELQPMLACIDSGRITSVLLRDIDYELGFYERLSEQPSWLMALRESVESQIGNKPAARVNLDRELWQNIIKASSDYAIGRASYIVGWQAQIIADQHAQGNLDDDTIQWLSDHITELDAPDNPASARLGYDFDRARWIGLRDQLMAKAG